jgi:hypothetical protein
MLYVCTVIYLKKNNGDIMAKESICIKKKRMERIKKTNGL